MSVVDEGVSAKIRSRNALPSSAAGVWWVEGCFKGVLERISNLGD